MEDSRESEEHAIRFSLLEGTVTDQQPLSEKYWGRRGWTSATMNGRYVGCPELPDGSEYVKCVYSSRTYICN